MTDFDERAEAATNEAKCDHICLKDAGHVERGEPHFYGYEHPSPRDSEATLAIGSARLHVALDHGDEQDWADRLAKCREIGLGEEGSSFYEEWLGPTVTDPDSVAPMIEARIASQERRLAAQERVVKAATEYDAQWELQHVDDHDADHCEACELRAALAALDEGSEG